MDTVGTGRAQQVRLSERQLGCRLPCPRRRRRPSVSGTRFINRDAGTGGGGELVPTLTAVAQRFRESSCVVVHEVSS